MTFNEKKIGDVTTMEEIAERIGREDIEDKTIVQEEVPAGYIGPNAVFKTYKRKSLGTPFTYAGNCLSGHRTNFDPREAIRQYICSPYAADTPEELEFNVRLAAVFCRAAFNEGRIPIAPHLYFPAFLKDHDKLERAWSLEAGLMLLDTCKEMTVVVLDGRVSTGMRGEISRAIYDLGLTPYYIHITRQEAEELVRLEKEKE